MLNNKVREKVKESRRGKRARCLLPCEEEEERMLPSKPGTAFLQFKGCCRPNLCLAVRLWRGKGKERGGSVALVLFESL